jgi:hypothetical protein
MTSPLDLGAVHGLDLRSLLVLLLIDAGQPLTVSELDALVRASGFELAGRPGKAVADALRWEVRRGRARKVKRGLYAAGAVAKVTKHRMRRRVAETRNRRTLGEESG